MSVSNLSLVTETFGSIILQRLSSAVVSVICNTALLLPFINDTKENIDGLLKYCIDAKVRGIICFGIGLTLRDGDREYFYSRLDKHFPNMKERYIYTYGNSYQLTSSNNNVLMNRISEVCRNHGIMFGVENVFSYLHKFESKTEQLSLFDGI